MKHETWDCHICFPLKFNWFKQTGTELQTQRNVKGSTINHLAVRGEDFHHLTRLRFQM